MNIVFFDIHLTGHHAEYIDHIVENLVNDSTENNTYHFVIHPDFEKRYEYIVSKSVKKAHIHWHSITDSENDSLQNLSMIKRSFVEYEVLVKYGKILNADKVFLLYFNTVHLAFLFKKPPFKISGILFNQFTRMSKLTLKDKLKYYRKYFITKLYCKNKQIDSIFILNDNKSVDDLNEKYNTSIFKVLPDPILEIQPLADFDIFDYYNIPVNNKIFLHFGNLANRKGTFEIIEAASLIKDKDQDEITFLLVGEPIDLEVGKKITERINATEKSTAVQIIWDSSFVTNEMMTALFRQCFAVLVPYKNPEASSGILGHAIRAKKPVCITGEGLLKELVEKNNFGILINEVTPSELAKKIVGMKGYVANERNYSKYIEEHSSELFSKTLLK